MSNPALSPPQPPPSWTHTPETVLSTTKELIEATRSVHDKVAATPAEARNFTTVILPLAEAEAKLEALSEPVLFYQNVSTSKELRDASSQAEVLIREFSVDASMRIDVFNAIQGTSDMIENSKQHLEPEEKRLVEKLLLDGKRAGLTLPEEDRKTLAELKKELSQVSVEFGKNFNEENGSISFTLEELDGVPGDVLSGYKKQPGESGKPDLYKVTFKTPDIMPLFKFASNPETRRRASAVFEDRLSINVPLFDKGMKLRRKIAKLLGYKTWADYITEVKMAKTAENVNKFLDDILVKLKPVGIKDMDTLLALKKEEHQERGYSFDDKFYLWDYRYYDRKFVERTLELDDSLVKEYFPVSVVVGEIMNIYQGLLGVTFQEIKGETWHPDVQQFAVWEKDAKNKDGFIGYCYLDLFPRENKYSHAAVWSLIPGYDILPNKGRNYPLAAMVANLAKSTPERPALMRHDDVVTFFHEMGHVFHGLLSRTKFSRFHGTSVSRDFVEAPSQMLENWCWEPKVLKQMSSHYKTNEPLSDELISKLIQSRYTNVGLFYLRQGFFAKFDMHVHTAQETEDYTTLWNTLRESISLVQNDKEYKPGQGSFGHLFSGYDAGYYGYMYSLVFATDMYETIFKKDPLSPELGKLYREKILLPGGSRDELDSLKDFLGRAPSSDAFMRVLFGENPSTSA